MIELFSEPIKMFINGGIAAFQKKRKMHNFKLAIIEQIKRENDYNLELIKEIRNNTKDLKNETLISLIQSLRTEAFDTLANSGLPISAIFENKINKDKWTIFKYKNIDLFKNI